MRKTVVSDYESGRYTNIQIASRNRVSPTTVRNILIGEGIYRSQRKGRNPQVEKTGTAPPDPYPELLSRIATLFSEGKGNEEIAGALREEWVISKKV
jgi:hypothetical protein